MKLKDVHPGFMIKYRSQYFVVTDIMKNKQLRNVVSTTDGRMHSIDISTTVDKHFILKCI
ncbi:hypothetical protein BI036_gp269 [Morganella phage vB_MmoM_MP1]|uniref:Uncharacterized protein n=1 Tax=Morganella phage vB_MmoM_MP1 TaxID=1852628 RepID=A0A192YB02_9CAUD|nr:hypothetical protein BI036_gp269 [Morganella phage vB_MmoM_MP1]ANM46653.1 hypothetical protein MP1_gp0125 [Morganella phage vB_MmoM_MP1]